jgi:flagellar basal body-associated protein FliL
MKIVIDMSIGMMCTIGAIILIVITAIWCYKNSAKLTNHPIIATVAIIALILSVVTIVFLFFSNYSIGNISFNYFDASIAALSLLTAFLVGWNIWSIIDSKETIKKQNEQITTLENRIDGEVRYIRDKSNYDLGVIYGYFTQMLAKDVGNLSKDIIKYIMVEYMVNSVKILTTMQEWDRTPEMIDAIISSVIECFNATPNIPLTSKDATKLIERFGEIDNHNKLEKLQELKVLVSKFIV